MNLTTIFGLLTWISILVTHIHFRRARAAQGIRDEDMAYVSPTKTWGSYVALFFCCLIAFFKSYDSFVGTFAVETFVTSYLGIPLYLIMIAGYKLTHRRSGIKPQDVDLFSGKEEIDREEEAYLATQEAKNDAKRGWFYDKFVSWLF